MTIIALDTASKITGYAIYKDGKITNSGIWKIDPKQPLTDLRRKILSAIEKHRPSTIVAEDIYKSNDNRLQSAFNVLSQCQGILKQLSEETATPLTLILPSKAKYIMWGYTTSRASHRQLTREQHKARMIRAVELLGYTLTTDRHNNPSNDQADAIGILITYLSAHHIPVIHPNATNAK